MKNNFLVSLLVGSLCIVNMLSATKITPLIYALNTRGELYAHDNGTWIKGPLPKIGQNTLQVLTLAAGPSIDNQDETAQGQLYVIDDRHGAWSMPQIWVKQPFGNGQWYPISNPQTMPLADIAAGKDKLIAFKYLKEKAISFIWEKAKLVIKDVFGTEWKTQDDTDANFVAISQDLPGTAFHVGYRYRFLVWERGYNKPFYMKLNEAGWIDLGQKFKKIYAGVQGSSIGIDENGKMFANQQVFGPQSSWTELLAPQLANITTIEKPDDVRQWTWMSDQVNLAFGLTTNDAGEVINEIMMSMQLNCQNKQNLAKRIIKNVLWRRTEITTKNHFGLGWELVSLNSENEAPGLIKALSIGSCDQTKEFEKAQREAAAQKAAQTVPVKKAKQAAKKATTPKTKPTRSTAQKPAKKTSRFTPPAKPGKATKTNNKTTQP